MITFGVLCESLSNLHERFVITWSNNFSRYGKENINVYHNVFIPLEYTIPARKENSHCYCKLICLKKEQVIFLKCFFLHQK